MHLDLNSRGAVGDGLAADALEVVTGEIRRPFVDLIERLGTGREADLDWWVTPLASRNTYACPLYLRLCQLVLTRRLIQAGGVTKITTDSPAFAEIISESVGQDVRISVV